MSGPTDQDERTIAEESRMARRMEELANWRRRLLGAVRTADLLELLGEFGIRDDDLLRAVPNLSARTLRRYRAMGLPESKTARRWEQLDDLRSIIGYLIADGSYDQESVVAWLRSRQPALDMRRPLDVLGEGRFEDVLRASETALAPATVPGREVLQTREESDSARNRASV